MWLQFSKLLRDVLIGCFLIGSNLIILSGVSGLYGNFSDYSGVLRKKNLFLNIYTVSIVIYVILFIVLGLFAILYPQQVLESCNASTNIDLQ